MYNTNRRDIKHGKNGKRGDKRRMLLPVCLLLLAAWCLTACGSAAPCPEAEEAFSSQYEQAMLLVDAVYGKGFLPLEPADPSATVAIYKPVGADCPYRTVAAFRQAIEEIFSEGIARSLCFSAFDGDADAGARARYSQSPAGALTVQVPRNAVLSSLPQEPVWEKGLRSRKKGRTAEITLFYSAVDGTLTEHTVTMVLEGSRWKFDTLPYLAQAPLTE